MELVHARESEEEMESPSADRERGLTKNANKLAFGLAPSCALRSLVNWQLHRYPTLQEWQSRVSPLACGSANALGKDGR